MDQAQVDDGQRIDWNFHDLIIDSLKNNIISNNYRVNSITIRLIHQSQTRLKGNLVVPVIRDLLTVPDALEHRGGEKAVSALSPHIENARLRALVG